MLIVHSKSLVEIERLFGFAYPRSFHSGIDAFVTLCGSLGFQQRFPDARLIVSVAEFIAERNNMDYRASLGVAGVPLPAEIVAMSAKPSQTLVPFLVDEDELRDQDTWFQKYTYAFHLEGPGPEYDVVAWSYADPMIVRDWNGFESFSQWVCDYVRKGDV